MKNNYVVFNNRYIPVKYENENTHWTWMNPEWLGDLSNITPDLLQLASPLEEDMKKLNNLSDQEYLNHYISEFYANELKSSWQIEGEHLDTIQLRSSLVKHLCLNIPEWCYPKINVRTIREDNAVKAALYLINSNELLSIKQILDTHSLLKEDDSEQEKNNFGKFRDSNEIVGSLSKNATYYEIVYEAPPPEDIQNLMQQYIQWWHKSYELLPLSIGAALAHLYFVEIHPFHDGNGRMARLLLDTYLANKPKNRFRTYSMQSILHTHRLDDEKTLSKNSATTGASLPSKIKLSNELSKTVIYNRKQLTPYICISQEILRHPYNYYNLLEQYSTNNKIVDYIVYMIALQHSAVKCALERIPKLRNLTKFIEKHSDVLTHNECSILKNSYLSDTEYVDFTNVTSEISNHYEASVAWNRLKNAGLLSAFGTAILDDSLVNNLNRDETQSPSPSF